MSSVQYQTENQLVSLNDALQGSQALHDIWWRYAICIDSYECNDFDDTVDLFISSLEGLISDAYLQCRELSCVLPVIGIDSNDRFQALVLIADSSPDISIDEFRCTYAQFTHGWTRGSGHYVYSLSNQSEVNSDYAMDLLDFFCRQYDAMVPPTLCKLWYVQPFNALARIND